MANKSYRAYWELRENPYGKKEKNGEFQEDSGGRYFHTRLFLIS